jgi:uncharacterized protein YdhG (YjbR/CyaY superfamily)
MMSPEFKSYFDQFSKQSQQRLTEVYETCKQVLPDAIEKMSYGMPCFSQKQNVVYFAAFKNHIGFYPTASGVKAFENELNGLNYSKGAIQFPLNKPIPRELIRKIILFRLEEINLR